MPVFHYKAVNAQGEAKSGSMTAGAEAEAVARVQAMGLILLSVDSGASLGRPGQKASRVLRKKRLGQSDITDFTRQLSILIGAGLSLDRALKIIAQVSTLVPLVELVETIQAGVREGEPLSKALAGYPRFFSDFYLNFIRSAEMSGNMAASLNDLAVYLEKSKALREQLVSALIYPAILVGVTLLSLGVIVVFVLPEFAQLFADMNASLPASTAFVLGCAEFFKDYAPLLAAAVIAAYLYVRQRKQDETWRLAWDQRLLSVTLLADLIKKIEMARLSRSLGTLLCGGVPMLTALKIARESLQNRAMSHQLEDVVGSLKEGSGLAAPLMETGVFPDFALQMIQVGEETGKLDEMLIKVADIYDNEVSTATQRLLSIMEPVLIIGLGVMIGGIIMSILVAILSINELPL